MGCKRSVKLWLSCGFFIIFILEAVFCENLIENNKSIMDGIKFSWKGGDAFTYSFPVNLSNIINIEGNGDVC